MSHPLMVEAIETLFVPLLIHNNKKGADEVILKRYEEPAWNNPVIRYVDSVGKDVIPRRDRVWTTGATARRMIAALKATRRPVPQYLQLTAAANVPVAKQATFAMHCYWEGEVKLGSISGVLDTRAGWIGKKEVVHVTFDPAVVSYVKLLKTAQQFECASTVFAHDKEQLRVASVQVGDAAVNLPPESDQRPVRYGEQKYHLRRTPLRFLPLTRIQLVKVNSAVFAESDYRRYLSPAQVSLEKQIQSALRKDKSRLHGLAAPDDAKQLQAYAKKLRGRLKPAPGTHGE